MLLAWLAASLAADPVVIDRLAAVVNNDVVTLSEVYGAFSDAIVAECPPSTPDRPACVARAEGLAVDALVRQRLIRQELAKIDMDVTNDEVDRLIDDAVEQHGFPDREALRAEVEASGFGWDEYRTKLMDDQRRAVFQGAILRPRITFSDDEVIDRYQRLVREQESPEVVRLAAFGYRLPSDATAEDTAAIVQALHDQLDAVRRGERSWSEVAEANDTAHVARVFEGQTFGESDLMAPLSKVAFSTPPGSPTEPVIANGVVFGLFVLTREQGVVAAKLIATWSQTLRTLPVSQVDPWWASMGGCLGSIRVACCVARA